MTKTMTDALVEFARETLCEQCCDQAFDFLWDADPSRGYGGDEHRWQDLETIARAQDPTARWMARVVFVKIEDGSARTAPAVLPFPTNVGREELFAAIRAEADRRGYLASRTPILVYDFWGDVLLDLAEIAAAAPARESASAPAAPGPARPPLRAARGWLARAGNRTAPARRRIAVSA